jgi:hypothetical protein
MKSGLSLSMGLTWKSDPVWARFLGVEDLGRKTTKKTATSRISVVADRTIVMVCFWFFMITSVYPFTAPCVRPPTI